MTFFTALELDQVLYGAGLLGFFLYMASFAALQFRVIEGQGLMFPALNVLAASLVLASLTVDVNLASALIQIGWIVIGCAGIFIRLAKPRSPKQGIGHQNAVRMGFAEQSP